MSHSVVQPPSSALGCANGNRVGLSSAVDYPATAQCGGSGNFSTVTGSAMCAAGWQPCTYEDLQNRLASSWSPSGSTTSWLEYTDSGTSAHSAFSDTSCSSASSDPGANLQGTDSSCSGSSFPSFYRLVFDPAAGGHQTSEGCVPWTKSACGTSTHSALCCSVGGASSFTTGSSCGGGGSVSIGVTSWKDATSTSKN